MSIDMTGINQSSLFSQTTQLSIFVGENSKYRIMAEFLPWEILASTANEYRSKTTNIENGRPLNLRVHLGAYIAQSMNNLTDRMTEDLVRYHGGVRILCGLEESSETIDHTSIEKFRNSLGKEGAEALNQQIVQAAVLKSFTGSQLCSSDTTAQQSPIAHPTEVGHLKNIADKLTGIGTKIKKGLRESLETLQEKAKEIFTEIRLFTRGTKETALEKKKKLSKKLHKNVSKMCKIVEEALEGMTLKAKSRYQADVEFYRKMLSQIIKWLNTGNHPANKIISLWEREARSISRGKIAKTVEFGRRWIITRLTGGYIIGSPVQKLGGGNDVAIADEVLINFLDTFGEVPKTFVYDRGGDGPDNHELLDNLGIKNNCIFPKGNKRLDVGPKLFTEAKRERALSEAAIATVKHAKYGFDKPRARSSESCALKGQMAIFGANMTKFCNDLRLEMGMRLEIG